MSENTSKVSTVADEPQGSTEINVQARDGREDHGECAIERAEHSAESSGAKDGIFSDF